MAKHKIHHVAGRATDARAFMTTDIRPKDAAWDGDEAPLTETPFLFDQENWRDFCEDHIM